MPAGYSGRSLSEKLGIKPGMTVRVLNAPEGYQGTLGILPDGVKLETSLGRGKSEFIHYFARDRAELAALFSDFKRALTPAGTLWVSWPKQGSGLATDLKESIVMEVGLANGLVDVKVAAIDETWSGLKFVYRRKDR